MKYNRSYSLLIIIVIVVLSACERNQKKDKKYIFKSIHIEYSTKSSNSEVKTEGTKTVWIDDYGDKEAIYEHVKSSHKAGSKKGIVETETLTLTVGDSTWFIDLKQKSGIRYSSSGLKDANEEVEGVMEGFDVDNDLCKEFIEKNGGKWYGKDILVGKKCFVFEIGYTKMWFYKGLIMKIENNLIGEEYSQTVNSINEDIKVDPSRFKIPADIVITQQNLSEEIKRPEGIEETVDLSFEHFDQLIKSISIKNYGLTDINDDSQVFTAIFKKKIYDYYLLRTTPLQFFELYEGKGLDIKKNYKFNGRQAIYAIQNNLHDSLGTANYMLIIEYPTNGVMLEVIASTNKSLAQLESVADMIKF